MKNTSKKTPHGVFFCCEVWLNVIQYKRKGYVKWSHNESS